MVSFTHLCFVHELILREAVEGVVFIIHQIAGSKLTQSHARTAATRGISPRATRLASVDAPDAKTLRCSLFVYLRQGWEVGFWRAPSGVCFPGAREGLRSALGRIQIGE